MELIADIASWFFLIAGSIFILVGAVGILRLPDVFTRMHGAGIIDTLGAGLILSGLAIQAGFTLIAVKLVLIAVFLFFTSPTTTHALARAAIRDGVTPLLNEDKTKEDEPSKT